MTKLISLIKGEPVVFAQLVSAALTVGAAFGLHLKADQIAAVGALLSLLAALVGRSQVSPVNSAPDGSQAPQNPA